jgi:hypothetical protein
MLRRSLLVGILAVACSSNLSPVDGGIPDGGPSDGGNRIADVCGAICGKLLQCEPDGGDDCTGPCPAALAPFRDEFTQGWARCVRDTACADLFQTTSTCADAGASDGGGGTGGCSASTVNVCLVQAGTTIPTTVLEPFFTTVCPGLVNNCSLYASDAACRSALTALESVKSLIAFPDDKIQCVGNCEQSRTCAEVVASTLNVAISDCGRSACGISLGK